ncbi:hypothetical protein POUND7_008478 [Theobroma cacao]
MQAVPSPSRPQPFLSEPESTLVMQPEERTGEGEDVKNKEDNISEDSGCFSNSYGINLSLYRTKKGVSLSEIKDRDEQVALLLDVLK